MTKKQPPVWLIWVFALIIGPGILVYAIMEITDMGKRKSQPASIEELVDKLQNQLPQVHKSNYSSTSITQTGLEIHGDTLLSIGLVEAPDSILAIFRKPETISMLREDSLQAIISDYENFLLTEMACNARMIISYRFYDKNGAPVYSLDYGPSDYLPLLNKE